MYVHPDNNPGNIEYDCGLYVFIKSWFMPVEEGGTSEDRWLFIPALRSRGLADQELFTAININLETVAMMVVTEDGVVTKGASIPPGKKVPKEEFEAVKREALNISEWERATGQAWPYSKMFEGRLVRERYQAKYGSNQAPYGAVLSDTSISYNNVRRAMMSRPCNCGNKS